MSNEIYLKDERIIETIATLCKRIDDRFPACGLSRLCEQLLEVARKASVRSTNIGRPVLWIRLAGYCMAASLIALLLGTIYYIASSVRLRDEEMSWTDLITNFDAATSGAIVISAILYFLISLEMRIKRRRALQAVHELRAIAHVVDMHQLTKDPERAFPRYRTTSHSPQRSMTPEELSRYLDYCSEMLSLIGKIAALYIQRFDDPAAVAAVSDVEQLTTGLSRKIWQKIVILSDLSVAGKSAPAPTAFESNPAPIEPPSDDSTALAEVSTDG
ncbi:hypothetical protein [Stieleria varia]|uniref:Uncharacterized protein n=1 Tax=Stieleria varia TaxID=2528005 RepID=A0A5C6ASZ5_9BACT|nr:hypothetical protein [Stieleria varia]TWU02122.1 hypothetical protein Pla52n_31710 [Stieleria varia]